MSKEIIPARVSPALADDRLGKRLALDLDRHVVGIVVIGGGVRELAHQADVQQVLVEFHLVIFFFGGASLGAFGRLGGRRGGPSLGRGELAVELLAELPHLLRRQGFDAVRRWWDGSASYGYPCMNRLAPAVILAPKQA